MNLKGVVEGILFVVGEDGITLDDLKNVLEVSTDEVKSILTSLRLDYEKEDRGIKISFLGNTFKLTTKNEHRKYYDKLLVSSSSFTLSNAALETLAIVAYNEPITRIAVDSIRGVSTGQIIRKLVARGFLKECGKEDSIGRPTLYKTTNEFLDYFGLATKEDLPKLIVQTEENNDIRPELIEKNETN